MGEENHGISQAAQKKQVLAILEKHRPLCEEEDREQHAHYSLETPEGAQLYAAFSDEELLEQLRSVANRLGHSPAQREVHWILRDYLRSRFRNWPGALRAAGLSRAAGKGGVSTEQRSQEMGECERLLDQVRERARALGRMPHPSELPEVCQRLKKHYQTWGEVLEAAGAERAVAGALRKITPLEAEFQEMLDRLRSLAEQLNRAPLRNEVDSELRTALIQRFGSWRNTLYQIDLEPVRRMTPFVNAPLRRTEKRARATHRNDLYDCHYRLLHLDPQTQADLEEVHRLSRQLGRPPHRREVPPPVRQRLQEACGSWSNALFQLKFYP